MDGSGQRRPGGVVVGCLPLDNDDEHSLLLGVSDRDGRRLTASGTLVATTRA